MSTERSTRGLAIAVEPRGERDYLLDAVAQGGGRVVGLADAEALVWAAVGEAKALEAALAAAPDVGWVQLLWAGVEPYVELIRADGAARVAAGEEPRLWTCGKGVYAEPVAEHALAMMLAGLRNLPAYSEATSWSGQAGRNLLGASVVVFGAGGITESLLRLLGPFGCAVTVVRHRSVPMDEADRTLAATDTEAVDAAVGAADVIVVALALTPETSGLVDAAMLDRMADHAWLVNVGRGGHVVTDDLVAALAGGLIGGAALDVTEPEPLPDGHPLWGMPNCLITPHTANTLEMAEPLLIERVRRNVALAGAGEKPVGAVDPALGY